MVIQINYDPGIAAVSKLSYQAGKGEFMKWKAGFDQRADQYRAQALLGGFGAGSSLGMGISNLRQQRHLGEQRNALLGQQIASREKGFADKSLAEAKERRGLLPMVHLAGQEQGIDPDVVNQFALGAPLKDLSDFVSNSNNARSAYAVARVKASPEFLQQEAQRQVLGLEAGAQHDKRIEDLVQRDIGIALKRGHIHSPNSPEMLQFERAARNHYREKMGRPPIPRTGAQAALLNNYSVGPNGESVMTRPDGQTVIGPPAAVIAKMKEDAEHAEHENSPKVRELDERNKTQDVIKKEYENSETGRQVDALAKTSKLAEVIGQAIERRLRDPRRPQTTIMREHIDPNTGEVTRVAEKVPVPVGAEEREDISRSIIGVLDLLGGGRDFQMLPSGVGVGGSIPSGTGWGGMPAIPAIPAGTGMGGMPAIPAGTGMGGMPAIPAIPAGTGMGQQGFQMPSKFEVPDKPRGGTAPGVGRPLTFPSGTPLPESIVRSSLNEFDNLASESGVSGEDAKPIDDLLRVFKQAHMGQYPKPTKKGAYDKFTERVEEELKEKSLDAGVPSDISSERLRDLVGAAAAKTSHSALNLIREMNGYVGLMSTAGRDFDISKDKRYKAMAVRLGEFIGMLEEMGYGIPKLKLPETIQKSPFVGPPTVQDDYHFKLPPIGGSP